MEYVMYKVGEKVCEPCSDTIKFDMTDNGAVIYVAWRNPSEKEIEAFKGTIEIKEIMLNGVIFICLKPETLSWLDAPYHRDLSRANIISALPAEAGSGLQLHLQFINASTGVLLHQRIMGLSTNFTNRFFSDIRSQSALTGDYDERIAAVYNRYSSSDLAKHTTNRCKFTKD